jgi:hypothetical protein
VLQRPLHHTTLVGRCLFDPVSLRPSGYHPEAMYSTRPRELASFMAACQMSKS